MPTIARPTVTMATTASTTFSPAVKLAINEVFKRSESMKKSGQQQTMEPTHCTALLGVDHWMLVQSRWKTTSHGTTENSGNCTSKTSPTKAAVRTYIADSEMASYAIATRTMAYVGTGRV